MTPKRLRLPLLALATLAVAAIPTDRLLDALPLSDQVGVYGLIDKVEFVPDAKTAKTAKTVRIHGAFAVAQGPHGDYYRSPRWGVLGFRIDPEQVDKCRKQWADLASVAGTGKVVGFGFRYRQKNVRVAAPSAKLEATTFQTGMGVRRVRNANYGPIMQLRHLPKPVSPLPESSVWASDSKRPEQSIEFTCKNCIADDASIRYLFEFEQKNGDIRGSKPLAAGDGHTSWKTTIALEPGAAVKWRVRVIADDLSSAPVATGTFVPVAKKQ